MEITDIKQRRFQPAVDAIKDLLEDEEYMDEEVLIIAIDGRSGSGKTTLADFLAKQFDANVFHMDDFFLQSHQRTEERLSEVGGNVDYERFREEVLIPLWYGDPVSYRPFSCKIMEIDKDKEQTIKPKRINIVEGSYSQHPYFGEPYQLRVFLDIDEESQLENISARTGGDNEIMEKFRNEWIPKEEEYIKANDLEEKADVYISWN
ncbi:uridine kinase family protein [Oribacterium sp. P6A1]|uniref:uridine kinase family protein n=1 Tax=Oribacterium sp. P6A1 TaxID=1410612 RepID=UPI0005671923|nr:deoxynucleoside kinase [Oribacterium sp. P6A1]